MSKDRVIHEQCLFNVVQISPEKQAYFINIITDPFFDHKRSFSPAVWPPTYEQKGPMCGINAFLANTKHGKKKNEPYITNMQLRKNSKELSDEKKAIKTSTTPVLSARKFFKDIGATTYGPIYDIRYFALAAEVLGIENSMILSLPDNEEKYITALCNIIKNGFTVIIASEVSKNDDFPGCENGSHTHWASLFGWVYLGNIIYFLVNQYGEYYLWSGKALFDSNYNLPLENPMFGSYSKKDSEAYRKIKCEEFYPLHKKKYQIKEKYLSQFRFKGFAMEVYDRTIIEFDCKIIMESLPPTKIENSQNIKKIFKDIIISNKKIFEYILNKNLSAIKNAKEAFPKINFNIIQENGEYLFNKVNFKKKDVKFFIWLLTEGDLRVENFNLPSLKILFKEIPKTEHAFIVGKIFIQGFNGQTSMGYTKSYLERWKLTVEMLLSYRKFEEIADLFKYISKIEITPKQKLEAQTELKLIISDFLVSDEKYDLLHVSKLFENWQAHKIILKISILKLPEKIYKKILNKIFLADKKYNELVLEIFNYGNKETISCLIEKSELIILLKKIQGTEHEIKLSEPLIKSHLCNKDKIDYFIKILNFYNQQIDISQTSVTAIPISRTKFFDLRHRPITPRSSLLELNKIRDALNLPTTDLADFYKEITAETSEKFTP